MTEGIGTEIHTPAEGRINIAEEFNSHWIPDQLFGIGLLSHTTASRDLVDTTK